MANLDELRSRQTEIRDALAEINTEFAGRPMPDDQRARWNELNEEFEANKSLIGELEARAERVEELSQDPKNREETAPRFNVGTTSRVDDPYDLSTIELSADPERVKGQYTDRARRAIDSSQFPHERAKREDVQEHVERLLETSDDEEGTIAKRIVQTGSPTYKRAFGKAIAGKRLAPDEERALSQTTTAGGFAVPFALDPTIIPTSNLSVNPYRAISNVKTITVSKWEGVTSAGVTASFAAEAVAATDNSPTLAQPVCTPTKAHAFIPFSIEIGQDWGSLQSEMAKLLQDAKDDLEADRFTFGTAATPEPEGIVKAGTAFVSTAATATFAIADLYSLEEALPPRFRPRASFIGNRKQYNRVRQFDTAGGAGLWLRVGEGLQNQVPTPGSLGNSLMGYPAYELSPMVSTISSGSLFLMVGDFSYFVIVDRVGMDIELIPHLFGASQGNLPTGQRGLYCYWRTGSVVTSTNAFRILKAL